MSATATKFDVFLSHNAREKPAVERIAERLRAAGLEPWLDKWHLTPGGRWQEEMGDALYASAACAVFIGPADLGDWEIQEVALALDRGAQERGFRVFPVLLPGVREPFDPNALPHFLRARTWVDFRRGYDDPRALQNLIHAIKGIPFGPENVVLPDNAVCPYRGLQVFDLEHSEFYFGRDAEIQRLLEKLKTDRFLAVLGPSGSGKSSLVRAGLTPALLRGRLEGSWQSCVLRPGAAPLTALAAAVAELGASLRETLDGMAEDPRTLHLALVQAVGADAPEKRVLMVVDQLEEVFTLCHDEAERRAFFSTLLFAAAAPGGPAVVVLTLRADFYPRCAAYPELSQLISGSQLLVGAMGRDALRQAIEEPARRVGLEFEAGLVDTILDDAGDGQGSLPLVEHALLELWERRRGSMLTLEGYREAGGVEGALAQRADDLLGDMSGNEREIVRRTLLRLTQPGDGTEDTRRRAPRAELLGAGVDPVLDRLIGARLLTTSSGADGEQVVDVSHEALIRAWPRLREWIDSDRAGLRLHRRLTEAAQEWERLGHDEGLLFRGARLAEAVEWDERNPHELNEEEGAFLTASAGLARRERTAQRRARVRVWGAGAIVVVVGVVAAVAYYSWREQSANADRERSVARSRSLANASEQQLAIDPERGLLLAREAARTSHTVEAEHALRAALQSPIRATLRGHKGPALAAAFSPDGRRLATAGEDGTVRLWDPSTQRAITTFDARAGQVYLLAFSGDGKRLASAGSDGDVRVWPLAGGDPLRLRGDHTPVRRVEFNADGTRLVRVGSLGRVDLFDAQSGKRVRRFGRAHLSYHASEAPDAVRPVGGGAGFNAPGRVLRAFGVGSPLSVAAGPSDDVLDAAFVLGGRRLALAAVDGVRVADARTGRSLARWGDAATEQVATDAGGDRAAATDRLGRTIRVWDTRTGREIARLRSAASPGLRMSTDGRRVLTGTQEPTIWELQPRRARRLTGTGGFGGSLSPDGRTFLSRERDGRAKLWDQASRSVLSEFIAASGALRTVAFSADGRRVATVHDDGTVRVWDPALLRLDDPSGTVDSVPFVSPDGSLVAAGTDSSVPVAWDAETGRIRKGPQLGQGEAVGFTRSGRLIIASGRITLLDARGRVVDELAALGISANERRTVTVAEDRVRFSGPNGENAVTIDPPDAGENVVDPDGSSYSSLSVGLSPDGRLATVRVNATQDLFDAVRGRRLHRVATGASTGLLTFSPDSTLLVGAYEYGSAGIWSAKDGRLVRTLPGHHGDAQTAQFSSDGRHVVTTDDESTYLWDTKTGRRLLELAGGGGAALLPGDRAIVSVGESQAPVIRACVGCGDWRALLERADERALRELSAEERRSYAGGDE